MADTIDTLISRLAKRGYVTRRRLLAAGIPGKAIDYRISVGRLIPVYTGVYAVGHIPTLPQDRAFGALLACGSAAVLSHGSAASLWRILSSWDAPFEVTTPTLRRRPGIRIHRAALARADWRVYAGIRVTSPARTALDIAPRLSDKALRRGVNRLRAEGHLTDDQLADVVGRFRGHPGAVLLRPFAAASGFTRSDLEDRFVAFCERFGLPAPQTNVRVAGREVDAFFPKERVIVELDGYTYHSSKHSFRADRENDASALAADLLTVRITDDRLEGSPAREAERLRAILGRRRRAA